VSFVDKLLRLVNCKVMTYPMF